MTEMLKLNLGQTLSRWLMGFLAGFISCSAALAADQVAADQAASTAAAQAASPAGAAAPAPAPQSTAAANPDVPLGEVVVTGYRQSLAVALDRKKLANGSEDVIMADDIADFPDLNLAESLQRVPGVSIARDAGEGRQISVRGLGPQFTRVRINGMEAMSANGGTDAAGGTNRDRSFDFNTFASELFNSVTVRKSSAAEIEEGSLGATVDLRTGRPFDYHGLTVLTSVTGAYSDISDDIDPRVVFLASDTWADGRFGALISAAYTKRELADEGSSTVRWQQSDASAAGGACLNPMLPAACFGALDPAYTSAPSYDAINRAFHPRIPRFDKYTHEQERLGVTASLQFQPTESMLFSLDALYANYKAERNEIFLEAPVFSTNGAAAINNVNPVAAEVDSQNTLVYGVFQDVDIRSEARFDKLETDFTHVTLDGAFNLTDSFKLNAFVGFSEANHDNPVQTTLLFDHADTDGYSYDYRANDRLPLITYGTTDVTSPATWTLTQVRLRPQSSINSFQDAALDLEWTANEAFALKFGPQWKKFTFKTTSEQRSNGTTANQEGVIPASVAATPVANFSKLTTFGNGLDLPAGSVTTWLMPDVHAAESLFDLNNKSVWRTGIETAIGNNYEIDEEDTGGYVQGDFRFPLGSMTLRGNLGVRYVETKQTSKGFTISSGVPLETEVERTYSDTLPSLNLVWEVTDDFFIRGAAAKVMVRPNGSGQPASGIGILAPGAAVTVAGANKTVTAGNPLLEPFRAKSYDLSFEWYFQPEALVSLALFYKDIDSFVQIIRTTGDFAENPLGLPDSVAIAACGTAIPDPTTCLAGWQFSLPANTPGGNLKGVEVSYQQPFSFMPAPFNSFGVQLNYTYVESKIDYLDQTGAVVLSTDLTNLSKNAYNATLYFENTKFSARLAASYRDDYLTTVPGRNGNDVEGTASTFNLDFSSSLRLNKSFELTLEALNLTDEFQDQWVQSDAERLSYYHHQGRTYLLGARFSFGNQ
ncbi:MAG TPA: TonB-dependent receptor [Steroidobacteraceae bacterium]|nr:TonB-dependent receptor [Steroidobacteraceae bacterium]